MTPRKRMLLPLLALTTASTIWASSFIALKVVFQIYDPMVVIFGRMAVASTCFLLSWRTLCTGFSYRKGDWRKLLFMAMCEPGLYFIFEALALENTDASQVGMITAILPLLVAIAARFFLKERISAQTMIGLGVALTGVVWFSAVAQASVNSPHPAFGNFMEFLAIICTTGYIISLKSMTTRYTPWVLTAIQSFVGTIFYMPLAFASWTSAPINIEPLGLVAILYLGVCVTLGGYGLYNYGMSKIPANQASAFMNLIPVMTLFLGRVLLDEQLSLMQYAASVLVLAGVILSQIQWHTSPPNQQKETAV